MNKIKTIQEAISIINNGDTVGIGGNVLHRSPIGAIGEIVRAEKKDLKIIKTAGALDVDMLCFGECVQSVDAGFISYESEFGLANHYRKGVQNGVIKGNEHACYTVMCALRASAFGVPFMPVKGLINSDLIEVNDYFDTVKDPFTGETVTVVKKIRPNVSIIHVQECDRKGNAKIYGPKFDDILLAKASEKVIITTESIVDDYKFKGSNEKFDIPHFLVSAVVHLPKGAVPCSCVNYYDIDKNKINKFLELKNKTELLEYIKNDLGE